MPYEWIGDELQVDGIPGIPARELTDGEAEVFGVKNSPYYRKVARRPEVVEEPVEESNDG